MDELFAIYHVDRQIGFTQEKFERLTSALLQQIESEVCAKETHDEHSSSGDVDSKQSKLRDKSCSIYNPNVNWILL